MTKSAVTGEPFVIPNVDGGVSLLDELWSLSDGGLVPTLTTALDSIR